MTISATEFKQAMQLWASGVTVVTTYSEKYGLQGMTVSAFSSVSAESALILCCVNDAADTILGIDDSQSFAVNVLTTQQQETSNQFAGGCSVSIFTCACAPSALALAARDFRVAMTKPRVMPMRRPMRRVTVDACMGISWQ